MSLRLPWRLALSRNAILSLTILGVCVLLLAVPASFQSAYVQNVRRARARVVEVDNHLIQQFGVVKSGSQSLRVRILDGDYRGQEVEAANHLLGKMETDKMFDVGDTAYIVLDRVEGGRILTATAYDHYRLDLELLLVALFAALLIAFSGWSGVRAILSLIFSLLIIWKVLLPSILLGYDAVWVLLAIVVVITAVTLLLVAGVNRTALTALIGACLGIAVTVGLASLLLPSLRLHGAVQPFSEMLLHTGFASLNLSRMFLAAVFLGASGAVMDVAIDVATAMHEVVQKRPDLSRGELVLSGFAVGRNMTSTMITTLLMAYVSGYMALLMVFMAQGVPPLNYLNTNYVAAEIVRTLVGSFGLVTVAPFTALVGGWIFVARRRTTAVAAAALPHPAPARGSDG